MWTRKFSSPVWPSSKALRSSKRSLFRNALRTLAKCFIHDVDGEKDVSLKNTIHDSHERILQSTISDSRVASPFNVDNNTTWKWFTIFPGLYTRGLTRNRSKRSTTVRTLSPFYFCFNLNSVTFPVRETSPVMATFCRTGLFVASDRSAVIIVQPAEGPSLGVAPCKKSFTQSVN